MTKAKTALIGLLLVCGLGQSAFGITYLAISLDQAVQGSEVIVVGRVESLAAAKDLGKGFKFSLARVRVAKVLKNTSTEAPIGIGDEVSIQVWADGAWGKVPYTKGKEGVWLLRRVPDKTIFVALHPMKFQPLTKEEEIVALLAKQKGVVPPTKSPKPVPRCALREGLVAHWSGEGNANDSAGQNHGTLKNGATFRS